MTSVFSWQNTVSLCPASFCTSSSNLPVSRYILTSYFGISVPSDEMDIFLLLLFGVCSFYKVLQVFIEPFKFRFFSITDWGIDLNYCDVEWFALEMNRDHSVVYEIVPKYCISNSFIDYEGYSISSKGFLPTVVDIPVM